MSAIDVGAKEWDEKILRSKTLAAVDFWAPWCPWCKKLLPVFEELAAEYGGKIVFAKVNVDAEEAIATKHGIMGIPVIKFFCDGKEIGELVGYMPKSQLKQEIDKLQQTYPQCLGQTSAMKK